MQNKYKELCGKYTVLMEEAQGQAKEYEEDRKEIESLKVENAKNITTLSRLRQELIVMN